MMPSKEKKQALPEESGIIQMGSSKTEGSDSFFFFGVYFVLAFICYVKMETHHKSAWDELKQTEKKNILENLVYCEDMIKQ